MNRLSFVLAFLAVGAVIVASWIWLGQPIPIRQAATAAEAGRIPCISYAPFRRGQSPIDLGLVITEQQIEDDLARLAKITSCIRTYSLGRGLDRVPEIAQRHGMKVILGMWLSSNGAENVREIEDAVRVANQQRDTVRMLVVGNEVLLRGEISPAEMRAIIAGVKTRVPVPVTYAEVWEFWKRNPGLAEVVDVITIHVLPYWEDHPLPAEQTGDHLQNIYREMAAVFPGKPLLVGEVGWPSKGRQRDSSRATPSEQARVVADVLEMARRNGLDINIIEAFDQPWKRELEGTVGGYWGLMDADSREAKFQLGAPVSDHPSWPLMTALGLALAASVFGAAYWSGAGEVSSRRLLAVAVVAAISGVCFGLALEQSNFLENDRYGAVLQVIVLVLSVVGPILLGAAIASDDDRVSFAAAFGDADERRAFPWAALASSIGMIAAVTATAIALGLVFDPRYREFLAPGLVGTAAGMFAFRLVAQSPRPTPLIAERWFSAVLAASAVFIALHEGLSNGQAAFFCAVLLTMSAGLLGGHAARSSGSAARQQYPIG